MIIYFKETLESLKKLDLKTLETIKLGIFIFIVINVIGIYWFFQLKKIAIAILMVTMFALVIILLLERRKQEPMGKTQDEIKELQNRIARLKKQEEIEELEKKVDKLKKDNKEKSTKKDEGYDYDDDSDEDSGFSLPSAEEYNKKLEKSYGSMGF